MCTMFCCNTVDFIGKIGIIMPLRAWHNSVKPEKNKAIASSIYIHAYIHIYFLLSYLTYLPIYLPK